MILLYLRGLLKPDYPNGLRSVARENILLSAVAAEQAATTQMHELNIQAAFSSLFSPQKATGVLRQITSAAKRLGEIRALDFNAANRLEKAAGSVNSMTKLYEALVKEGIIVED